MYADPRHRKDCVIKLRLDAQCVDQFRAMADARHLQPAVLARQLIEEFLLGQGVELPGVERSDPLDALVHRCARRAGVVDAEWRRQVIEQYLADHGYDLAGDSRRVG